MVSAGHEYVGGTRGIVCSTLCLGCCGELGSGSGRVEWGAAMSV